LFPEMFGCQFLATPGPRNTSQCLTYAIVKQA
jgi:hypothetical protein